MKRLLKLAAVLLGLAALAAGGAAWWLGRMLDTPYDGTDGTPVTVELERGMPARATLDALGDAGVVEYPDAVLAWLRFRGTAQDLQAGEYRFEGASTPRAVVGRLVRGDVVLHAFTIPEGLTVPSTIDRIVEAGFADRDALTAAAGSPEALAAVRTFDPSAEEIEGYLFPDTYRFPRGESADRIVSAMIERFLEVVGAEFAEEARAVGLSPREAVVLASLIERETGVSAERARVSRVFHNRLERGMLMQCDPTVIYAIEREGREVRRLTLTDLRYDSPWNTYRYPGLPPGPICSPGRASLMAAVKPADGPELFFVAAPGGGHRFSETLAQHNAAVREWRRYSRSSR